jgi:hypothetical protein
MRLASAQGLRVAAIGRYGDLLGGVESIAWESPPGDLGGILLTLFSKLAGRYRLRTFLLSGNSGALAVCELCCRLRVGGQSCVST